MNGIDQTGKIKSASNKRFFISPLLLSVTFVVASCSTISDDNLPSSAGQSFPNSSPARAVIKTPTTSSFEEIQALIAQALGISKLTLATTAFTQSDTLVIEQTPKNQNTTRLNDKIYTLPERFFLRLEQQQCYLLREKNNTRWRLQKTTCTALNPAQSTTK